METVILKNLVLNEDYARKVVPFLQEEYFHDKAEKTVFNIVSKFILKYNNIPTKDAVLISLGDEKGLGEVEFKKCSSITEEMYKEGEKSDTIWLVENTEMFCKEKAIYNGIMESIGIIEGKDKEKTQNAIPEIMSKALSVSFDTRVGHDFLEDVDERYEYYHRVEEKIPFDLEMFNIITRKGVRKKTLNVVMAASGVGKSAFLCHHAAACLSQNLNVLYITLEMAEEEIAKRIDANLLDTDMHVLENMPLTQYESKVDNLKRTCKGKLIIKEYPARSITCNTIKAHIEKMSYKGIKPDLILIDYAGIIRSTEKYELPRLEMQYVIQEIRKMAKELDCPVWTALQSNKDGAKSDIVDLTNMAESYGQAAEADFQKAIDAALDQTLRQQGSIRPINFRGY